MRRIMIIFTVLFLANRVMAQNEDTGNNSQGNVLFGVHAGYTMFNLKGSGLDKFSTAGNPAVIKGWLFGADLNVKLSSFWGLKHEISVVQKGAILKLKDDNSTVFDSKYRNMYLDLAPVSITFNFQGLQLFAGPYMSMLINSSIQRKDENGVLYTDKSIYGNAELKGDYTQKFDAGIVAGLGYEFKNGLNIGGRYNCGLTPLLEHTEHIDGQWEIYNRGFAFTLGYSLSGKNESDLKN